MKRMNQILEMVEDCVQLFSRVPDGTTRIDECFVEISKICRRRAERSKLKPVIMIGLGGLLKRSNCRFN